MNTAFCFAPRTKFQPSAIDTSLLQVGSTAWPDVFAPQKVSKLLVWPGTWLVLSRDPAIVLSYIVPRRFASPNPGSSICHDSPPGGGVPATAPNSSKNGT